MDELKRQFQEQTYKCKEEINDKKEKQFQIETNLKASYKDIRWKQEVNNKIAKEIDSLKKKYKKNEQIKV